MADSFCLIPSKSDPSIASLKEENASLKAELEKQRTKYGIVLNLLKKCAAIAKERGHPVQGKDTVAGWQPETAIGNRSPILSSLVAVFDDDSDDNIAATQAMYSEISRISTYADMATIQELTLENSLLISVFESESDADDFDSVCIIISLRRCENQITV